MPKALVFTLGSKTQVIVVLETKEIAGNTRFGSNHGCIPYRRRIQKFMIRLEEEWLYTVLEMFFPHEEKGAGAEAQV